MNKETISDRQSIILMILYIIGFTTILVVGKKAKQDLWLAIILAFFMAWSIMLVYARIQYLFPRKDLFDIIEICFGKFLGKIICFILICHILLNAAAVLSNISLFITTVALINTPIIAIMILTIIISIWIIMEGIEVICRCAELMLILIVVLLCTSILLLIPKIDIHNLQPILYNGMTPVLKEGFAIFIIPLTSTVILTTIFSSFERKNSPYLVYSIGLFGGTVIIFVISLITLLVLGINSVESLYFPSYSAAKGIKTGNIFQRLEVIAALIFVLGSFMRFTVMLLSACKGLAKTFAYKDYRFIVTPLSLFLLNLGYIIFESTIDYTEVLKVWPYYAAIFQVVLPLATLLAAEIKCRINKKNYK